MNKNRLLRFAQTAIIIGAPVLVNILSKKRDDETMEKLINNKIEEKLKALPDPSKES